MVEGNYIGTDATGSSDLGNSADGIEISGGAQSNVIGGLDPNARNILAGNDNDGIWITGSGTDLNIVQGNWIGIGTDSSALGNTFHGIGVEMEPLTT